MGSLAISVQEGLYQGVPVQGSLSRWSVWRSLSRGSLYGGLCLGEGISVQGLCQGEGSLSMGSLFEALCPGKGVTVQEGLCPVGSLSRFGSLSRGVCLVGSVHGVSGGVCQGGSLSGKSLCRGSLSGVSVQGGGLCPVRSVWGSLS